MDRPSRRLADALLAALTVGVVAIAAYAVQPVSLPPAGPAVQLAASPTENSPAPPTAAPSTTPEPAVTPTAQPVVSPSALLIGRDLASSAFVSAFGADLKMPVSGISGPVSASQLSDLPSLVVLEAASDSQAVRTLRTMLAMVGRASPTAKVVVVGPLRRSEPDGRALRSVATSAGAAYLDPLAGKWLISTVRASLTRAQRVKFVRRLAGEIRALPG